MNTASYIQYHIDNERDPEVKPFDFLGFILLGLSLAALLFALDTIVKPFISQAISGSIFLLGILGLGLYYFYAHKHQSPVISPKLFHNKSFSCIILGSIFIRTSLGAPPFMGPLLLQMSFSMTAMQAGLYTGTAALSMLITKRFVSTILRSFSLRKVLIVNSILVFFGLNLYTLLCFYHTPWFILFVLMLNGAFASLQFSAMNSGSYSNLSAQHQSMGTSFLSSFQQILQSFGIALSAFILSILLQGHNPTHYPAKFFALTYFALSLLPLISTYIFWQFKNLYAEPQLPTKTEIQTSAVD